MGHALQLAAPGSAFVMWVVAGKPSSLHENIGKS